MLGLSECGLVLCFNWATSWFRWVDFSEWDEEALQYSTSPLSSTSTTASCSCFSASCASCSSEDFLPAFPTRLRRQSATEEQAPKHKVNFLNSINCICFQVDFHASFGGTTEAGGGRLRWRNPNTAASGGSSYTSVMVGGSHFYYVVGLIFDTFYLGMNGEPNFKLN